jgi:thiamine biosynthesis protein ThiS
VTVTVTLNGDRTEVEDGASVAELLRNLGVTAQRVVVEHNRRILRTEDFAGAHVAAGDELEVVHFVGGG